MAFDLDIGVARQLENRPQTFLLQWRKIKKVICDAISTRQVSVLHPAIKAVQSTFFNGTKCEIAPHHDSGGHQILPLHIGAEMGMVVAIHSIRLRAI